MGGGPASDPDSSSASPPGHPVLVGRESELEAARTVLEHPGRALVITGEPGIGKTTIWQAIVDDARARGLRTLCARPTDAEARLSHAGLSDLFEEIDLEALPLPSPQAHALAVALVRADLAAGPAPEPNAIALATLNALRALAAEGPVLVAVDDAPSLDPASAEAVAFAARRLRGEDVRFALARRPGPPGILERALGPREPRYLELGPLSLGASRRMLLDRLDLTLPRRALRRVVEVTRGNPLFLLEIGRSLLRQGVRGIEEDGLPIPETVEDLLGTRVAALPRDVRRLLLALALGGDIRTSTLARLVGDPAIEEAERAGLVLLDGERVRPAHPLLLATARGRSTGDDRRELHRRLADLVDDQELRALHLALAADAPDPALSAALSAASSRALGRGAVADAVTLAEHALRLTPDGSPERPERLLALAGHLLAAGDQRRAADLLLPEVDGLPDGAARVRGHLLLADSAAVATVREHAERLELALAAAGGDRALRGPILVRMVEHWAVGCVERIDDAAAWAREALDAAPEGDPGARRSALNALGWTRVLVGRPVDDLVRRSGAAADPSAQLYRSPERLAVIRRIWRGELAEARALLTDLLAAADRRGEEWSYAVLRLQRCELELRAGDWSAAAEILEEWGASPTEAFVGLPSERCRALLAVGLGNAEEAEERAARAMAAAQEAGIGWERLEVLRTQGAAALLAGEPARAVERLHAVWDHAQRAGVRDPGTFPVAADLVEALVETGGLRDATAVTAHLAELAEEQAHPWGLATAARCGALIRLVRDGDRSAAASMADAAEAFGGLGLRFDRARTLLALGRAARRRKWWAPARRSLEAALVTFAEMGSHGWEDRTRAELARVAGRRARPPGSLTPAERRAVELAAQGLSNREIAQALFVTVRTVETHLSRAYAKLGVRSRTQLGRRLGSA